MKSLFIIIIKCTFSKKRRKEKRRVNHINIAFLINFWLHPYRHSLVMVLVQEAENIRYEPIATESFASILWLPYIKSMHARLCFQYYLITNKIAFTNALLLQIVPFRLRLKCKTQYQEMGALDHASQTGCSIGMIDSASDDLIWYVKLKCSSSKILYTSTLFTLKCLLSSDAFLSIQFLYWELNFVDISLIQLYK